MHLVPPLPKARHHVPGVGVQATCTPTCNTSQCRCAVSYARKPKSRPPPHPPPVDVPKRLQANALSVGLFLLPSSFTEVFKQKAYSPTAGFCRSTIERRMDHALQRRFQWLCRRYSWLRTLRVLCCGLNSQNLCPSCESNAPLRITRCCFGVFWNKGRSGRLSTRTRTTPPSGRARPVRFRLYQDGHGDVAQGCGAGGSASAPERCGHPGPGARKGQQRENLSPWRRSFSRTVYTKGEAWGAALWLCHVLLPR